MAESVVVVPVAVYADSMRSTVSVAAVVVPDTTPR